MTTKELEQVIVDLIQTTYDVCYNKHIHVKELLTRDGRKRGYELLLDLDNYEKPISWLFDGKEEAFLKFVKKELYNSLLWRTQYFNGYKYYKEDEKC